MKNIVETAQEAGTFNTLVRAVQTAGLEDVLSGQGPFTVCAPNDAAFDALPEEKLDALMHDRDQLANVLKYHVASGIYTSNDVREMKTIRTLLGQEIPVRVEGNNVMIGDARVIQPDIEATNGIIHILDRVLIP
ncbi:MAG TPA: fasciclin domain-containing protein [Methanoculleus sp.]|nr:fasciclin domain-containing protein [Methanoculleus sp.]